MMRRMMAFGFVPAVLALIMGCGGHRGIVPIDSSDTPSVVGPSRGGQAPNVPTLYFPPNRSAYTTPNGHCLFALRTTDPEGDRVQYKIEVFQNGQLVATFDQTRDPKGWCNLQDLRAGTWGSRDSFASGEYAYLKAYLPAGTYQWRAAAFDGTSWSNFTSTWTFIKR